MSVKNSCERCSSPLDRRPDWNVTVEGGVVVGLLCPDCQTAEENAEAEINLATTRYARDAFGRLLGSPMNGVA